MSERLNFAIDGEFLTNIARDWFWNMNKSYKKCEELLLSCMAGGSEEEKRHIGAAKDLIFCTSAAGLRCGTLRWAIRSSIWMKLVPQPRPR